MCGMYVSMYCHSCGRNVHVSVFACEYVSMHVQTCIMLSRDDLSAIQGEADDVGCLQALTGGCREAMNSRTTDLGWRLC